MAHGDERENLSLTGADNYSNSQAKINYLLCVEEHIHRPLRGHVKARMSSESRPRFEEEKCRAEEEQ